jgi:hypothetical protein
MEIKCDKCGKTYNYKGGIAHFNRCIKHFCSRYCQNVIHGLARRNNTDKRYNIWCNTKKRAKKNGTKFTLTVNDIPEIPEYCPVLNIKIKANTISAPLDSSPSLDRINPKRGYVAGNIRIICNRANRIKSDATVDELKLILKDAKNLQN